MNNAFDAKISRPTTIYTSMAGVDIGGAWGRHWFVRKWGETANFILHFFTLSLTRTSFLAYFQCLDKIKQCKWLLWMSIKVVLQGRKQWNSFLLDLSNNLLYEDSFQDFGRWSTTVMNTPWSLWWEIRIVFHCGNTSIDFGTNGRSWKHSDQRIQPSLTAQPT